MPHHHRFKCLGIGLMLFLAGCSLQQVRPQALTVEQPDLSHIDDGLGILLLRLDGSRHVLTELQVLDLEFQQTYSHPFVDAPDPGSSVLEFEQVGGANGALEHVLFLHLPPGKYRITELEISDKAYVCRHRVRNIDSLYFEFGPQSPAYLGELFISLGKQSRSGKLSDVKDVFLMPSVRAETNLKRIAGRYPALRSIDVQAGKIWRQ